MTTSLPKKQTAAIFHKTGGPVNIEQIDVPDAASLKPGEAIVKLEYSGVCHTDLHAMLGDWPLDNKLPLVGGHEGAGHIVAINPHTETDLKVGDAVGLKWIASSCNRCAYCRAGDECLCSKAKVHGFSEDGTFQRYAKSFCSQLTPLPDGLPLDEAAPILCAGVTVFKALKESGAKAGQTVAIPGAGGGLGHLAIQYATAMGLRSIAIDTGAEKKALCEKLGAIGFVDFKTTKNLVEDVKKLSTDGLGAHAAIVASASAGAYEQALDYLRPHGNLVAVGLPASATMKADVFWTVFQMKRITGSYVGNRSDAIEALQFAADGKVKCVFKTLPLSDLPNIYKQMHDGSLTGRTVLKLED